MAIPPRAKLVRILAIMTPLLCATSLAHAAECRGYKVVQSCTTTGGTPNTGQCAAYINDIGGAMYQSCVASAPLVGGIQTCTPIQVPCDYPDNIVDAISKLLSPAR